MPSAPKNGLGGGGLDGDVSGGLVYLDLIQTQACFGRNGNTRP